MKIIVFTGPRSRTVTCNCYFSMNEVTAEMKFYKGTRRVKF